MDPNPYFDPDIKLYSFTPLEKKIQATVLSLYRAEGVEALSVSKLCRAGGFSRTGFYYHYATPRDALTAWECDFLGRLIAISGDLIALYDRGDPSYPKKLRQTISFLLRHRGRLNLLLNERPDPVFEQKWARNLMYDYYPFCPEDPLRLSVIAGSCLSCYRYIVKDDPDLVSSSPEAFIDYLHGVLTKAKPLTAAP